MYHQIRTVFSLYNVLLPHWEAIRKMRATIREISHHSVVEKESIFHQPVFSLDPSELIADVKI